jgi:hypothetical protein
MSSATVTEEKRGRGRPRTKSLHRVDSGVYESKDGRFIIHGIGKRGRKQEWWIEDTMEDSYTSAFNQDDRFPSLNIIMSMLTHYYPDSF